LLAYDRVLENASAVLKSPEKVLEFFVTKRTLVCVFVHNENDKSDVTARWIDVEPLLHVFSKHTIIIDATALPMEPRIPGNVRVICAHCDGMFQVV